MLIPQDAFFLDSRDVTITGQLSDEKSRPTVHCPHLGNTHLFHHHNMMPQKV